MTKEQAGLKVLDDSDAITVEELRALKEISRYYSSGKFIVSVLIGVGACAVALVHSWDFIVRILAKGH